MSEFRQGEYRKALKHFLRARAEGRDSPALRYNLAATYYRLGRYAEARRLFEGLRPSQPVLAPYNLGLIARARGDTAAATRLFREAYDAASADSRLRALAAEALRRSGAGVRAKRGFSGGVQLAVGFDDNVSFEPADSRAGREDGFAEGYVWGAYERALAADDRLRVHGGLYTVGYAGYGRYDLTDLSAGAVWSHALSPQWQWSLAGRGALLWQSDTRALDSATARTAVEWTQASVWRLRAAYAGTQYRADEAYAYLDGARHELRLVLTHHPQPVWWQLRYERRWDNRADFRNGSRFSSYSPRSHRLRLSAGGALAGAWSWVAEGEWHAERYPAPDTFTANGEPATRRREDRFLGLSMELQRDIARRWHLFAEFRHGNNDSNIDLNDYRRNVIMAGVGWRSD